VLAVSDTTGPFFEAQQAGCILWLDEEYHDQPAFSLNDLDRRLNQIEQFQGQVDWGAHLLHQGVIAPAGEDRYQLVNDHPTVIKVRTMRTEVVKTVRDLVTVESEISQVDLVQALRPKLPWHDDESVISFLEMLKDEGILYRIPFHILDSQPWWGLNPSHRVVIEYDAPSYLTWLALGVDHALVREGYLYLYENTLPRHLGNYLPGDSIDTVYKLGLAEDWVRRRESKIQLNEDHPQVRLLLRNQETILHTLSKCTEERLTPSALWKRLNQVEAFTLNYQELVAWISLFQKAKILRVSSDEDQESIELARTSILAQRLLGRLHVYGLIRNLRIMHATRRNSKRPRPEVVDKLTNYVTRRNAQLAEWTVDYAESINLLDIEERVARNSRTLHISLRRNQFLQAVDRREAAACKILVALVRELAHSHLGGWVPRDEVLTEMSRHLQHFGYARTQNEYWIDQAIYRRKQLKVRKRGSGRRVQEFLKVVLKR
jgi:hypothetical protein